jgi:5-methylcytosine-specific restriction enzyme subunit McrC
MTRSAPVVLGEYERTRMPAPAPSEADLRLSVRLSGDADDDNSRSRLSVRWLQDGQVEFIASSWVGVVRFSSFDVHVQPKYVGGPLGVLQMLQYASGIQMLRRLPNNRPLPADGSDLFDLICLLLTEEALGLLRGGLLRDYRATEDTLPVLRGRLRTKDQYLRRYGQLHQLDCSFDEYDADTPENQFIAAALNVARQRARDPGVRRDAHRVGGIIAESCNPPSTAAAWYQQRISYDRRNLRYRPAHELAALVLTGTAFKDLFDTSSGSVGAFLLDMNAIFERFITRLVEHAFADTDYTVDSQAPIRAVIRDDATGRSYTTIRPDLVITSPTGKTVPVDVKYKLYENRRLSTADLYQAFTYAYALGQGETQPHAGIIYPAHTFATAPTLSIKPLHAQPASRIVGTGIDVPTALARLADSGHDDLLIRVRHLITTLVGEARPTATVGTGAGTQQ